MWCTIIARDAQESKYNTHPQSSSRAEKGCFSLLIAAPNRYPPFEIPNPATLKSAEYISSLFCSSTLFVHNSIDFVYIGIWGLTCLNIRTRLSLTEFAEVDSWLEPNLCMVGPQHSLRQHHYRWERVCETEKQTWMS